MQYFILLRRNWWCINIGWWCIYTHDNPLSISCFPSTSHLQVKVDVLPGPDPHPTGAAKEATCQCDHRPEDQEHGEGNNCDLAISVGTAGIAIHIRQNCQSDQHETRYQHTGATGWEVVQEFLQSQEVPGRFRWIGRHVWIRRLA